MNLHLTFIKRKIKTLVNSVIHFTQTSFWKYIRSQLLVYFLILCNMCAFENIFQKDSKSLDYLFYAETSGDRSVFAEDLSWVPFTQVWECTIA